jgi:hypothetical protein
VLEGRTTDVVIVPISIQYERVLEGRTYVVRKTRSLALDIRAATDPPIATNQ